MSKLKKIIKNEFQGWKVWECIWLVISVTAVFIAASLFKDSKIAVIASVCGIFSSVLTGKGKLSAYFVGGVSRVLYAIVAFPAHLYGEVMLNLLYFVPMEFYGIYVWYKNMDFETHEVQKKSMKGKQFAILLVIIAAVTVVFGFFLKYLGGVLPFVDSFTNVISVIAMLVTIKRYRQTWILWMVVNAVSIVMWIYTFANGTGSIAILLMWIIYFSNSLIMYLKWKMELSKINHRK